MKQKLLLLCCAGLPFLAVAAPISFSNNKYTISSDDATETITIATAGGVSKVYKPTFVVTYSPTSRNPIYDDNHSNYLIAPRTSVLWKGYEEDAAALTTRMADPIWKEQYGSTYTVTITGSGTGRVWDWVRSGTLTQPDDVTGDDARGTIDPFQAGDQLVFDDVATAILTTGTTNVLRWTYYSTTTRCLFTADLVLPSGDADPRINTHMTCKSPGYFSVIFTGMPAEAKSSLAAVPQEVMGSGKYYNHVVGEHDMKLPSARYAALDGSWSGAIVADPSEMPMFTGTAPNQTVRLINMESARFGFMMERSTTDLVKPIAIAPLLGGSESSMVLNERRDFTWRIILREESWLATYRYIATALYGFTDRRDNTGPGSMNRALERVVDFLADRNGGNFAMWDPQQKYYDYFCDYPGTFKSFSPLYGLSTAVVMDDRDFYERRALPQVEYAVSRAGEVGKTSAIIFQPYDVEDTDMASSATRRLGASHIHPVQLAGLHSFFGRYSDCFRQIAESKLTEIGKTWTSDFPNLLGKYALTGNTADRDAALAKAAAISPVSRKSTPYQDWVDIHEAALETTPPHSSAGDFLRAAVDGIYAEWVTTDVVLSPPVPGGTTMVTADPGNVAPIHDHQYGRNSRWGYALPTPMYAKEQLVPPWRLALVGMPSEGYRAEFWMDDYGQCMRLAFLDNDSFLKTIARSGMVGRFANYPGDNREKPSLVIEQPDLPEKSPGKQTHATFNPGHAWELSGEVLDFLVSSVFHASGGQIQFPGRSMRGSAFRVRSYGDRPGKFYSDPDPVYLWMPKNLVTFDDNDNNPNTISDRQVDYISGYSTASDGKKTLYVALINQSSSTVSNVDMTINPDLVKLQPIHDAKRRAGNGNETSTQILNHHHQLTISAKGITVLRIPLTDTNPLTFQMHGKMRPGGTWTSPAATSKSMLSQTILNVSGTQKVNAMLMSMGKGLTTAYIYSTVPASDTVEAVLRYRQDSDPQGAWSELHDGIFPYEFTVPFNDSAGAPPLEFNYEIKRPGQTAQDPLSQVTAQLPPP